MNTWEKSAGDRNKFFVSLSFLPDPDEGKGATKEEGDSWGSFQIWVKGINLCAYQQAESTFHEVNWYLLPLLEWFVENWEPLFHEERLPFDDKEAADANSLLRKKQALPFQMNDERVLEHETRHFEWRQRHSLETSADGGLFPNVIFRRWRELVEISWEDTGLPGAPDQFSFISSRGFARISPELVADPLYSVVKDAISFLCDQHAQSTRLLQLKKSLETIAKTPRDIRIAWMAGLGHEWKEINRRWQRVRELLHGKSKDAVAALINPVTVSPVVLGSCDASLMFGSVSPTITEQDVLALAIKLVELYNSRGDQSKLKPIAREEPLAINFVRPWDQGYQLALATLNIVKEMGLYDSGIVRIGEIVDKLGIVRDSIKLQDGKIRAVAIAGPKHRASILLNKSHYGNMKQERERFTIAHELCHLLYDRAYGTHLAMASGPWSPVQLESRANAFAAMFLMPPPLVESAIDALDHSIESDEDVEKIASAMGTSFSATVEHLHNLDFIDTAELEEIKEQRIESSRSERLSDQN